MKEKLKKTKQNKTNQSIYSTQPKNNNIKPKIKKEKKTSPPTKKIFLNEMEEGIFYETQRQPELSNLEAIMSYKNHLPPNTNDKKKLIKLTNNKQNKISNMLPIKKIEVNRLGNRPTPTKIKKIEINKKKKIFTNLRKNQTLNNLNNKANLSKLIISGNKKNNDALEVEIPKLSYK